MIVTTQEERHRWSYFPIENTEVEKMYQQQVAAFWTKGDILFTDSSQDINLLSEEEITLLHGVLAVFSQFDGLISEKVDGFTDHPELKKIKEVPYFFRAQNLIETIHNEVYGLMIIHYVQDKNTQNKLIAAATTMPAVKRLADWIVNESNSDNLIKSIFVNALTEGVMFQGLFAIIFWFRKTYKGKFLGLTKANELISRDENLHAEFMLLLIKLLRDEEKCSPRGGWIDDRYKVVSLVEDLVDIISDLYKTILPRPILDLTSEGLINYTKGWANVVLIAVGHNPRYTDTESLDFMNVTSMYRKTNFFEGKEVGYQKGLVHKTFAIDESLLE